MIVKRPRALQVCCCCARLVYPPVCSFYAQFLWSDFSFYARPEHPPDSFPGPPRARHLSVPMASVSELKSNWLLVDEADFPQECRLGGRFLNEDVYL